MLGRIRLVTTSYRLCLHQALLQAGQEDSVPQAPQHLAGKHYFSFPFYCQDVPWDNLRSPCIFLCFVLTAVAQFYRHIEGHIQIIGTEANKKVHPFKKTHQVVLFCSGKFSPASSQSPAPKPQFSKTGYPAPKQEKIPDPVPKSQAASKPADPLHKPEPKGIKGEHEWFTQLCLHTALQLYVFSWTSAANVSMTLSFVSVSVF